MRRPFTLLDLSSANQEQAAKQLYGAGPADPQFPGCPPPQREFRFHAKRKWRFDFAWPVEKVALEVDGGVWSGGRHTRGSGWLKDTEKLNEAACYGWRMLRCTPQQLKNGEILPVLKRALGITTEL